MKHTLILILMLILAGIYFDYPTMFEHLPRSAHQWRQSDGASFAMNYYQNGMEFFKPQFHNLLEGGGYCVAEFTGLYYLVAVLYKIFGAHEGTFRLLSFIIFAAGLISLSKIILKTTNDDMLSYFVPMLLMTSPVLAFYAFSFLPNIPALGFILIGWYYFYCFYESTKLKHLNLASCFFMLGGLMKITALLSVIPVLGVYFLEVINVYKFKKTERIFQNKWLPLIPFTIMLGMVASWYLWANHYNNQHTNYFLMSSRAIWSIPEKEVQYAFARIFKLWASHYFHWATHGLIALAFGWILFTPKRHSPFLYFLTVLCSIGVILNVLIWLGSFIDHDYYVIELMIFPPIALTTFAIFLKKYYPKWLSTMSLKWFLAIFVLFNAYHTKKNLDYRQLPDSTFSVHFNPTFYEHEAVRKFLADNGITYPEKVVSIPDRSPNNSLYYMNLIGWTELFNYPFDTEKVKLFATYGANYLIITDKSYLEKPELQGAFVKPVANYKESIFIFDLRDFK
jgi:hypothetical protein